MSFKSPCTRIAGLFTTVLLLSTQAQVADATLLAPGGAIALSGTTAAAQPELGAVVLVDDLIPYQIFGGGVGHPLLYEGNLQARVARSTMSGNLIFGYRLRDPSGGLNGIMSTLEANNFAGWSTDVEYRTDGLGTKAPTRATRSGDGSDVSFIFGNSLFSSEESYFMHILTDSKAYTTGQTTLTLTDGSSVVLSTYQPAVPEPGSAILMAMGVAALAPVRSRYFRSAIGHHNR